MSSPNTLMRGFTIKTRMHCAIFVVLLMFAIVGAVGLFGGLKLKHLNEKFMEHSLREVESIAQTRQHLAAVRLPEKNMVIDYEDGVAVLKHREAWATEVAATRKAIESLMEGAQDDNKLLVRASVERLQAYVRQSEVLLSKVQNGGYDNARVAGAIADGDLTLPIRVQGRDEAAQLLQALGRMQDSLRSVVGQVRDSSVSIRDASGEVTSGNSDLSRRTEQAGGALQQTASSMEQLTGTVRTSADSAYQAARLATTAAEVAQRGGSVVAQVVVTMDDINTSSRKIGDIIGTIDGIAFQTNILALNAAVEAARAGEQGRGFAVVAAEVRSLAQRSAAAAREIKSLIGASVDKVEVGSRLVADAGSTMNEIVASVQRVSDTIGQISAAAGDQSADIGQVNTAVANLDGMTQQNAALVEQSAAAAESLRQQAERLSGLVGTFRLHAS